MIKQMLNGFGLLMKTEIQSIIEKAITYLFVCVATTCIHFEVLIAYLGNKPLEHHLRYEIIVDS